MSPWANSILTIDVLSNGFLHLLGKHLERLGTARYADTGSTDMRQGDTVMLPGPYSFEWWGPEAPRADQIFRKRQQVVLQHQIDVQFEFDGRDLALSVDQFLGRHLERAAELLGGKIERLWPYGADLVTAGLGFPPDTQNMRAQCSTDANSGLSVRCVAVYDQYQDIFRFRADILFGFTGVQTQWEYTPSPVESEMIALLMEARAEFTVQLATLKLAA